jgi:hypothetical protein
MNLEKYHALFILITMGLALVAAYPVIELAVPKGSSERFSEFWLLNPNQVADDHPFELKVGDEYEFVVGVNNNMGFSTFYKIVSKVGILNQHSDISNLEPNEMLLLNEYIFFVENEKMWESTFSFEVLDVDIDSGGKLIGNVSMNDNIFPFNGPAISNNEPTEFYCQLLLELWIYDESISDFRYDNVVWIWLNLTLV